MSSSSEYSGFSVNKLTKSSEKSTFSQTCNLLSQYIKDKGSFGGLNLQKPCTLEINGSSESSCHSGTTMELFPTNPTPQNLTTIDFLSPIVACPPQPQPEIPNLVNSSVFNSKDKEPKVAQLTMFYNGKVIVLDDFPADKVKEIMSFARTSEAPSRPNVIDLPIARKASLHRFLEKRKDRVSAKAPYTINKPISAPVKSAESIPWLGLGAKSTQV